MEPIALIRTALGVVTDRLLTIFSLVMTFVLCAWAMYQPDPQREAMAGFFALVVFLPALIKERKPHAPAPRVQVETESA